MVVTTDIVVVPTNLVVKVIVVTLPAAIAGIANIVSVEPANRAFIKLMITKNWRGVQM